MADLTRRQRAELAYHAQGLNCQSAILPGTRRMEDDGEREAMNSQAAAALCRKGLLYRERQKLRNQGGHYWAWVYQITGDGRRLYEDLRNA